MDGLVAALPFLLVPGLLATGRVGVLRAGLAGLVAATASVAILQASTPEQTLRLLGHEGLAGLWLAMQAVLFIVGGLFFYSCLRTADGSLFSPCGVAVDQPFDRRQLYLACFLVGPFAESATGFGVGMIIALPMIMRSGVSGVAAVVFSLLSQIFVAWGSLGVGSAIGAELAGVGLHDLQVRGAALSAPLLVGHLLVFWWLLKREGRTASSAEMIDDVLWTAALAGALIAANIFVAPELGALVATGALLAVRAVSDEPALLRQPRSVLRTTAPYVALTAILLATRTIPALKNSLQGIFPLSPFADQPVLAPLYHPAMWLAVVGLTTLIAARRTGEVPRVLAEVGRSARVPVVVTVLFVMLAQIAAGGGLAAQVAKSATAMLGSSTLVLTPFLGALSGFLTGSNTASNGMMMTVQAAIAEASDADVSWAAAMQNIAGATFTMLSPTRIASGCALVGMAGAENQAYARAWPFGLAALFVVAVEWWLLNL